MARALAVDVGTTDVKAAVIDSTDLSIIVEASAKAPISYPRPGWAEQDLEELWKVIAGLTSRLAREAGRVDVIAFSTHMAGVALLDESGVPLTSLITWLDERAAGLPRQAFKGPLRVSGYNLFRLIEFLRITGGAPSKTGKDAISKMAWLAQHEPRKWAKARYIADLKSYLLLRATGRHVTSPDEAHLKWLADTRGGRARWHRGLLNRYGIPGEKLPEIMESPMIAGELVEEASRDLGVPRGTPVAVGAGDVASVAVGSGAVRPGEYHVYVGTSDWVAVHVGKRLLDVKHYIGSLLSAIPGRYLVIAEQETAGAVIDWVLRTTCNDYSILDEAARIPPGGHGLVATPWMMGERAPLDDPNARMLILGIQQWHRPEHLVRAALDSVAANIALAFQATTRLAGEPERIMALGGALRSRHWARAIASAIGRRITVTGDPHAGGLRGAAILGLAAIGEAGVEELAARTPVGYEAGPVEEWRVAYKEYAERMMRVYSSLKKALADIYSGHG